MYKPVLKDKASAKSIELYQTKISHLPSIHYFRFAAKGHRNYDGNRNQDTLPPEKAWLVHLDKIRALESVTTSSPQMELLIYLVEMIV